MSICPSNQINGHFLFNGIPYNPDFLDPNQCQCYYDSLTWPDFYILSRKLTFYFLHYMWSGIESKFLTIFLQFVKTASKVVAYASSTHLLKSFCSSLLKIIKMKCTPFRNSVCSVMQNKKICMWSTQIFIQNLSLYI